MGFCIMIPLTPPSPLGLDPLNVAYKSIMPLSTDRPEFVFVQLMLQPWTKSESYHPGSLYPVWNEVSFQPGRNVILFCGSTVFMSVIYAIGNRTITQGTMIVRSLFFNGDNFDAKSLIQYNAISY